MNNMLGYNIYKAMNRKNVSLTQLAIRLHCDRSGLYKRLNRPYLIKVEELIRIGKAIGVNWRDLLEGVE